MRAEQADLFNLGPDGPASRGLSAAPKVPDSVLLHDASDAACLLAMGSEGISASSVAMLRGRLLASVRELAGRWGTDGPA